MPSIYHLFHCSSCYCCSHLICFLVRFCLFSLHRRRLRCQRSAMLHGQKCRRQCYRWSAAMVANDAWNCVVAMGAVVSLQLMRNVFCPIRIPVMLREMYLCRVSFVRRDSAMIGNAGNWLEMLALGLTLMMWLSHLTDSMESLVRKLTALDPGWFGGKNLVIFFFIRDFRRGREVRWFVTWTFSLTRRLQDIFLTALYYICDHKVDSNSGNRNIDKPRILKFWSFYM